jgi:putative NADPH-quinone reductase
VRVPPGEDLSFGPEIDGYIADLHWADHLTIVYPQWWGTYPAALKAFFDRVFVAGSAFRYTGGRRWEKLLSGRTARIVMTMDSPRFWNRLVYRNASEISIKNAILGYCGIKTLGITRLAQVRGTDQPTREQWLRDLTRLGRQDANRIRPRPMASAKLEREAVAIS